jgi:hypothetical protein
VLILIVGTSKMLALAGAVALLEKELDLECINKQLDEVNAFIDAVTIHKATIQ